MLVSIKTQRQNLPLVKNTVTLNKDYVKIQTLSLKCRFDIYIAKLLVNLISWIMNLLLLSLANQQESIEETRPGSSWRCTVTG